MSRQIKFRAYNHTDKKMYRVRGFSYYNIDAQALYDMTLEDEDEVSSWLVVSPGQFSLLQFTGLQDKAGRDIYEGDIVKDRFGRIMQVQWWNYRLCWVAISETNFHHADLYDWVDFDYEKEEKSSTARVEVIGNVYENPELLTNLPTQSNG
jgi:uncharacterized phage protein (TIGR01671 family)